MPQSSADDFDISKALADLAKGEQTATALENHLNSLEGKVDELLAFFEGQDKSQSDANASTQDRDPKENHEEKVKPEEPKR
ncbi:uncharacterized protein N7459_005144 [Penicillium hispanicum]|uniref:uncharacterized protein n=1 Tax=Penicillium hispanicum TaxID=1080232 RepID=UPI0025403526|nr:uncharacterized protein N7459_005144 [Penicillium hispanicum]KAJ5585344.1 hypothetical protein N7459_005144 [Penicillium hispanicum]